MKKNEIHQIDRICRLISIVDNTCQLIGNGLWIRWYSGDIIGSSSVQKLVYVQIDFDLKWNWCGCSRVTFLASEARVKSCKRDWLKQPFLQESSPLDKNEFSKHRMLAGSDSWACCGWRRLRPLCRYMLWRATPHDSAHPHHAWSGVAWQWHCIFR